jgi:hypothetical protein
MALPYIRPGSLTGDTYAIDAATIPGILRTPERYTRSKQNCQEFIARGLTRSRHGWRPFSCRIWAQDRIQAEKARHGLANCKNVTIRPVKE